VIKQKQPSYPNITLRSRFSVVDRDKENNIIYINDDYEEYRGESGLQTVTNDADAVFEWFSVRYGRRVRVLYRGTDMQWWEIVPEWNNQYYAELESVSFKPWHGMVWDILSKK
jgi:hypothetical protein